MLAHIYGLTDPDTGTLCYVGRTISPLSQRLREHINVSLRKSECARSRWIRSLHAQGKKPGIVLLEDVPAEQGPDAEACWIARCRAQANDLLNEGSAKVGGAQRYVIEWTAERVALLGVIPDEKLAVHLGIDRKTVEYHRHKRHIPRVPQQSYVIPPMGGWNKLTLPQHIIERMGTVPDYALAAEIGVSKSAIARRRRASGISSFSEKHEHPTKYKPGHRPTRWDKQRKDDDATGSRTNRHTTTTGSANALSSV